MRRGGAAWRLADVVLRQPVIDAATVATEPAIQIGNAKRAIAAPVDVGILTSSPASSATEVAVVRGLTALDDFAACAGRRR